MNLKVILLLATAAAFIGGGLYIRVLQSDLKAEKLLVKSVEKERDAAKLDFAQCLSDQQLTKDVSYDYQTKLANLNRQLATSKRLQRDDGKCTPVTSPAAGHNGAAGAGQSVRPNGIEAGWLRDYAFEAETYRLQLIGCQDFVTKTWESRQ